MNPPTLTMASATYYRNRYEQNYRAAIAKYERSAEYERLRALQYEAFAYHAPWPFFVPRAEFDGLGLA